MKPFNLPVAFTNYKVRVVKSLPGCAGKCELEKRLITVAVAANVDIARAVIWHEALHAILHEIGQTDLSDNESLVEGLALAIMRIRMEQPWL